MSYRPKNWPTIVKKLKAADKGTVSNYEAGIEVGADALLEALRHQPSNRGANVLYVDERAEGSYIKHDPRRKGVLVFIPDAVDDSQREMQQQYEFGG